MMKKKIYMHIGFGKTGSSALQIFLNSNPELRTSDSQEKILYSAFNPDGSISTFKELKGLTKCPVGFYFSSPEIANTVDLSKTRHDLGRIFSAGYTPIFSQEDWGRRGGEFQKANFFSELGCSAHVIAYVRPQVEWFNSAWWQWFAWFGTFSDPREVVDAWSYNFMLWADQISMWRNLPGVEGVDMRLYPQDVVEDLMSLLKLQKNPEINYPARSNVSLSPTLIKALMRNPEIRGSFDGEVDIRLSSLLKFDGGLPWVMDKELIGKIISATHADNLQLLSMLDEQSKTVMENDPRWWNPDFYASRPLFSKADFELEKQELLSIVDQAIPALIKLQSDIDQLVRAQDHVVRNRDQMLDSNSWKITKPLRFLERLFRMLHPL